MTIKYVSFRRAGSKLIGRRLSEDGGGTLSRENVISRMEEVYSKGNLVKFYIYNVWVEYI